MKCYKFSTGFIFSQFTNHHGQPVFLKMGANGRWLSLIKKKDKHTANCLVYYDGKFCDEISEYENAHGGEITIDYMPIAQLPPLLCDAA